MQQTDQWGSGPQDTMVVSDLIWTRMKRLVVI